MKKWKEGDPHPFKRILDIFIEFLKKQKQLVTADDILQDLKYQYVWSIDSMHTTRSCLWKGLLVPDGFDAQINIEFEPFATGRTYIGIFHHKKGLPLTEGWEKAGPIKSETLMKALFKE